MSIRPPAAGAPGAYAPISATWQPSTVYKAGELVTNGTTLYKANADFTSGASFNATNWTAVGSSSTGLTPTAVKTVNYTAVRGDLVPMDATAGARTVTLPASPSAGDSVGVYKYDSSANTVTLVGTVDGATNAVIVAQNAGATVEYVNATTGWKVVAPYTVTGPAGPTGPAGATGPAGPTGSAGPAGSASPILAAGVIGQWYGGEVGLLVNTSSSSQAIAVGTWVCGMPVVAQQALTIDQIGCYVQTAGTAGALVRLAIMTPPSSSAPWEMVLSSTAFTTLVDAGTVDASVTGRRTITLGAPQVITAGQAFVIALAVQGTGGAVTLLCGSNANVANIGWGSSLIWNGANLAVKATGVTGAFGTSITPTAYFSTNISGSGFYHRSA